MSGVGTTSSPPHSLSTVAHAAAKLAQRSIGKAVRSEGPPSVARVYSDVCVRQPVEYSDYEGLAVTWGEQDAYICAACLDEHDPRLADSTRQALPSALRIVVE